MEHKAKTQCNGVSDRCMMMSQLSVSHRNNLKCLLLRCGHHLRLSICRGISEDICKAIFFGNCWHDHSMKLMDLDDTPPKVNGPTVHLTLYIKKY